MAKDSPLLSDDTVIVLAQALTGLGHLRVTHALYHGLPPQADPLLLSSQDERINFMHKIASINPLLRRMMEFFQHGWAEDVFTSLARQYFRHNLSILEKQLQTILDQRIIRPKTLLVVSTHTNLAHQLAAIKTDFAAKNHIRVVLVVVVTDDSPQDIWAVGGADLIVVPSDLTRRKLEAYHRTQRDMPPSRYVVLPYLVSPKLATELTSSQFRRRREQVSPASVSPIHMAIPISGAAVQLRYFEKLIQRVKHTSDRFSFHVIAHRSPGTSRFLSRIMGLSEVAISVSPSHREVVELYETLYEKYTMSLEVTKPSEQSFKALLAPRERGGAILLFSDPVGRQEHDNLQFLRRHNLVPNARETHALWSAAAAGVAIDAGLLKEAAGWRGLMLPFHSAASSQFIAWCLREKLFVAMMNFAGYGDSPELSSKGVELFWKMMDEFLTQNL